MILHEAHLMLIFCVDAARRMFFRLAVHFIYSDRFYNVYDFYQLDPIPHTA